jgi:hypothetical protein
MALAVARLAMACLPFRRIASWLGEPGTATPATAGADEVVLAKEIGQAIGRLGGIVPWDGRCLAQALAAQGMLRRRGLEGTVNFGAGRGEAGQFCAHAWLRFGPCIVTGALGRQRFQTLTTLARKQ